MSEEGGCVWVGGCEHFGTEPDILWLEMSGEGALSTLRVKQVSAPIDPAPQPLSPPL